MGIDFIRGRTPASNVSDQFFRANLLYVIKTDNRQNCKSSVQSITNRHSFLRQCQSIIDNDRDLLFGMGLAIVSNRYKINKIL